VYLNLKPGKVEDFTKLVNTEILPTLKQQDGFRNQFTLIDGQRVLGISMWDNRAHAEKYETAVYPEIMRKLTPFIDGTPKVERFDVAASTLGA